VFALGSLNSCSSTVDTHTLPTHSPHVSTRPQQQAPAPSPFKSLAEKVLDFQAKTPARFKVGKSGAAAAAAGGRTASAGASRGRARQHNPHQPQCTEAKVRRPSSLSVHRIQTKRKGGRLWRVRWAEPLASNCTLPCSPSHTLCCLPALDPLAT